MRVFGTETFLPAILFMIALPGACGREIGIEGDADPSDQDADGGGEPVGDSVIDPDVGLDPDDVVVLDTASDIAIEPDDPPGDIGLINAVWGSSSDDVFAVGDSGDMGRILHFNGSAWSCMETGGWNEYVDVWGSTGSDVYALPYMSWTIRHFDGTSWSDVDLGIEGAARPGAIWGSTGTNVFLALNSGLDSIPVPPPHVHHYDGSLWSDMGRMEYECQWIHDLCGSSDTDVLAVGEGWSHRGAIVSLSDGVWSLLDYHTDEELHGVWGSSESDVFAVGRSGIIVHFDGSGWSEMESGTTEYLYGVWGSSPTDVHAVGGRGLILHYDGDSWSEVETGSEASLRDVWGSSATDVFAVGGHYIGPYIDDYLGVILHYDGVAWTEVYRD